MAWTAYCLNGFKMNSKSRRHKAVHARDFQGQDAVEYLKVYNTFTIAHEDNLHYELEIEV